MIRRPMLSVGWIAIGLLTVACALRGASRTACDELDSEIAAAADLRQKGNHASARTRYEDVLAKADETGCQFQEARVFLGLGVLAVVESRLIEALRLLDETESTLASTVSHSPFVDRGDLTERAGKLTMMIEFNRGAAHLRLGRLDEAHDALRRGRTLYRRLGGNPRNLASALLQFARLARLRDEPAEARDAVKRALRVLPAEEARIRASLWQERAWIEIGERRLDRAEKALDRAREAAVESENVFAQANVVTDYAELAARRGRWTECREQADHALDLTARANTPEDYDLNLEANAQHLKSVALWKLGDAAESIRVADSGLALLEAVRDVWSDRGLPFFAARHKYFRHRLDLAAFAEGPDSTWAVFEGFRSQGLLESTSLSAGSVTQAGDPAAREDLQKRRTGLLRAVRQLDHLDPAAPPGLMESHLARFRDRREALRALQAELRRAAGQGPPPAETEPDEARRMLDAETLALILPAGTEKIHVLTLDRARGLTGAALEMDRRTLEAKAAAVLASLDPSAPRRLRAHLERNVAELSHGLLEPLRDRFDGFRRLVVVADGPLERLPFGLLRHPRTGRRLIESHDIAYLPSFSILAALRERSAACSPEASGLFALGDPIFGSRDPRWPPAAVDPRNADESLALRRLAASAGEVESVARLYSDEVEGSVVVGGEATRERFLAAAPRHRVLHVASHAWSDSELPERSKIALACVDSNGQVPELCDLYFEDVSSLELCGQVVVLSACETAGGQRLAGEGILGLPRAFLHAGASAVVASLWQVADEPTAELMTSFHRHLRQEADIASALRLAKLELIENGRPPSVWTAFVLLGDWRTEPPSSTFSGRSGPMERTD